MAQEAPHRASAPSPPRLRVRDWMTGTPMAVPPHTSVRSAFMKMRIGHFRHLLVMEDGRLVGIVTDRDLRRPDVDDSIDGWSDLYILNDDVQVSDIMTRQVDTVSPEDPLSVAVRTFLDRRYGALPVVDASGTVRGILSMVDAVRALGELLPEPAAIE